MGIGISAVINTYNEQSRLAQLLKSLHWVDEIIVCDMYSTDNTVALAKEYKAQIYFHKNVGYVEPARNFAISKAKTKWILVLDADEEVSLSLKTKILEVIQTEECNYIEIPRKNIIFGKWMKNSLWWPDYHVRLFQKGAVEWKDQIHSKPIIRGEGKKLPQEESFALVHNHYESIEQYIERLNRYTSIEAEQLVKDKHVFQWQDLIKKPVSEFLGRYFANEGYKDGLHGFALATLQSFSFFIVYLKVWQKMNFIEQQIGLSELGVVSRESGKEFDYWIKYSSLSKNPIKKTIQKVVNKFR